MSEQRPRPLRGWGATDPERIGWRRNRDWIGRHTILAAIAGGVLAAAIGYAILSWVPALSATPRGDVRTVEQAAMRESYAASFEDALVQAVAQARIVELADRAVYADEGGDAAWAAGFRRGWADGWNDAIDAMRQASLEAGADPDSAEVGMLNNTLTR